MIASVPPPSTDWLVAFNSLLNVVQAVAIAYLAGCRRNDRGTHRGDV